MGAIMESSAERAARAKRMLEDRQISHSKTGILWGILSGATWGLDGVILGIALSLAPFTNGVSLFAAPLAGAALHDGFAGLWLLIYNIFTGKWREYLRTLATKPGLMVCIAALFGGPLAMSGYLLGISMAGPTYALPITAMYPVVGAFLAMIFLKEKVTLRVWIGLFLCITGAVIVGYTPPEGSSPNFHLGIFLSLLACLGWAAEGVISTFGMDMVDPDIAIGIREAASCVVYLVAVLPFVGGLVIFGDAFGAPQALMYLIIAAFSGALSYLAWYRALNMAGVGRGMALNITYCLWAIVFGWLITKTPVTLPLAIGACLIFIGTLVSVTNVKELLDLRKVS